MKKLINILLAGVLAIGMAACSGDLLNLDNPNSLTTTTAFNSEADIDATLTGVYHSFYNSYYAMMTVLQFSGQSDEMTSFSIPDIQQYAKHVYSNVNYLWNTTSWNQLYEQAARCNQVITYAENITEWSTFDKEQVVAQARAIRAYVYYQLAMMYMIPPYVDYVAPADDQPMQSNFDELCQHIIDDADYAYRTLPASYQTDEGYQGTPSWNNQVRVTKWFAAVVAGKTYMNWGDYQSGGYRYAQALPYFKDLVQNGGFSLVASYDDNFNLTGENNAESIFEIQNEASAANGWKNYWGYTNNNASPSQSRWSWKFCSAAPLGWSDYNADNWVLYAFKNEKAKTGTNGSEWDERIPTTIFYADIFDDFPQHVQWQVWTATEGQKTLQSPISTDTPGFSYADWNASRVYVNKYTGQYTDWSVVNTQNSEGTNTRIFRLGEVLLDYAECLAQTGDLAGAVGVIDQVRNRAGLCNLGERQDYKTTSTYTNSETGATIDFNDDYAYAAFENNKTSYTLADIMKVLDLETMKESAMEWERLVDLRRMGLAFDNAFLTRVKQRAAKYNANFTPVRAWIPMPTADVNNNPNLDQIPGW
ncbi:MAG: RagB/SusD family nutrient uptake outer membrane protein [Prevotellaceae bacterium]|jgi:hypothetical protein|nr:RagB/SusD family nutrient uptake outer membrane protein [Prevotellaceae bacterium]